MSNKTNGYIFSHNTVKPQHVFMGHFKKWRAWGRSKFQLTNVTSKQYFIFLNRSSLTKDRKYCMYIPVRGLLFWPKAILHIIKHHTFLVTLSLYKLDVQIDAQKTEYTVLFCTIHKNIVFGDDLHATFSI